MNWISLGVIAILLGQVEDITNVPTPAVRPATDAAADPTPATPPANSNPISPAWSPSADAARTPPPSESPPRNTADIPPTANREAGIQPDARKNSDVPKNPETGDIPDAANLLPPSGSSPESPPPTNPPSNPPSAPPNPPDRAKNQAQEIVAEALQISPDASIAGQPWQLAQALATPLDRKQQLLVIHGYWQLAEAVAKHRFAFQHAKQFEQLTGRPADESALRAARSASAAALQEAKLALLSAQHELAALLQLPADAPLPLPGDKPHVGGYRTNYQGLFAMRSPPPVVRVIDRTLPLRLEAVKARATAAYAAADACLAATEAYQGGQTNVSAAISSGDQLLHERRAFIETVCRYNHDIAEYAIAVLGPNITAQQLVGALIEPNRGAIEPRAAENSGAVHPAEFLQPATPPGQIHPSPPVPGQPTPALRPLKQEPTLVPLDTRPTYDDSAEKKVARPLEHSANKILTDPNRDPGSNPEPADSFSPEPAATAALNAAEKSEIQNPNRPRAVADGSGPNEMRNNDSAALYPALVDAAPAVRAKQLTLALHWDRGLPENTARPMSLSECLAREAGGNRRETLAVFWTARQRAAEYQAIAQELEFLENLSADALERRNEPSGAAEMLYLRAAKLSAKAALREAEAALTESQFELALRTQSTAEKLWPLPSTPPHSGGYELNLAAQPRQLALSRPMLRLAAAIPVQEVGVQERAAAAVDADAARAAALDAYRAGAKPLDAVLRAVAAQNRQTLAFLQSLSAYNGSIADFALAVLTPDVPSEKLAAALVVQP
ncbi:MAG: hypothetical protein IT426_11920 [Pirellulales bacterium]|nr:hypothetical protein [Pirellulales bacterium]